MTPVQALNKYFSYSNFRPGQAEIVNAVCAGHDTLALLPTGGGKSVCYQVPGLVLGGCTLVISPLISLMKDQVDALERRQIAATFINSSLSSIEQSQRWKSIRSQQFKFIYVAPERLQDPNFVQLCQALPISLMAVDEAHCISQWGHDFRPPYLQIASFVAQLPKRPVVMAVTATATPKVQQEIVKSLQLKQPRHFVRSFRRNNLFFQVLTCSQKFHKDFWLIWLLKKHQGQSGVIYTLTRHACEELCSLIKSLATKFLHSNEVAFYHGGQTSQERVTTQNLFLNNTIKVMIATNAFGMGVDKPNVRFVIHYHVPSSMEQYYQEAGRAGRDGEAANCYLLAHMPDLEINKQYLEQTALSQRSNNLHRLKLMQDFMTKKQCRNRLILEYFGETALLNCHSCDICNQTVITPTESEQKCYDRLLKLQETLARQHRIPKSQVMTQKVMHWLTVLQPQTELEFLAIPGIGRGWTNQWMEPVKAAVSTNQRAGNEPAQTPLLVSH